uniref:Uncharacterized protein n=1 Tax=uncultured prokaryote TaxID=198431 RepID=A0A0H5Q746_9ZZZZ|nr:hypothetical protein [uncultured prokaryote]
MPLPVPTNAVKVTIRFALEQSGTEVEEAQCGFWGILIHQTGNELDWDDVVQRFAEGIRDRWVEHITSLGFWSTAVRADYVRVDNLDADTGKVIHSGQAPFSGTGNTWQGSGADSLPWETTICVSLYGYTPGQFTTNKPRKRGRMYLPPPSTLVPSGPSGQMNQSNVSELVDELVAFFNDVQGMHADDLPTNGDYFDLRVVSRGTPLKPLDPTSTPITLVRCDSRVDSQRRREHSQPATAYDEGEIAHS